ncbi:hypothetical protein HAX54_000254 [Datura stramonium]|uniref:Uncharacterized protein n=1 Tax=Datura stramonium TaxID=4076 RepID=A0ABS8WS57_DATST|nr:hypothetical protein [Datura stramonium]
MVPCNGNMEGKNRMLELLGRMRSSEKFLVYPRIAKELAPDRENAISFSMLVLIFYNSHSLLIWNFKLKFSTTTLPVLKAYCEPPNTIFTLMVQGTAAEVGFQLQRDRANDRSPTMVK